MGPEMLVACLLLLLLLHVVHVGAGVRQWLLLVVALLLHGVHGRRVCLMMEAACMLLLLLPLPPTPSPTHAACCLMALGSR